MTIPPALARALRPGPLLLLAFAVRAALALWTETLGADGAYHLRTAQGLLDGRFGELLGTYNLHPLNPILTAGMGLLFGGVEAGGTAVGVVLSTLAVLPLLWLGRRYWNEAVAGGAGLLYALHPTLVHEGTEVLNTGAYLFLFLSALAVGLAALESRRWALFALAGAACGALYLTRPEGLLVPVFLVLLAAGKLRREAKTLLPRALLAAAVALAVAAPYLLWLRGHAGRWTITARPAAAILVAAAPEPAGEARVKPGYKIFKTVMKAQYPLLMPFLLLGLALNRRRGGSRAVLAWTAGLCLATLAPSILLLLKSGTVPPSHRYFLPAVSLLLPWTASGLLAVREAAGRWGWAAPAAVLAVLLAKDVGPRRAEERPVREAGAWIRAQAPPPGTVLLCRSEKIAWYAGLRPEGIAFGRPEAGVAAVFDAQRRTGAAWLALDAGTRARYMAGDPDAALAAGGFDRVAAFERPGAEDVRVYRRRERP
jgi:4-amino-4-deoxy-L-arabinose transferase-like glycosyltransferase